MSFVIHAMQAVPYQFDDDALYNLHCVSCDMCDTACVMSFVIHAMQAVPYQFDDDAPYNLSCVSFDARGTNSIT